MIMISPVSDKVPRYQFFSIARALLQFQHGRHFQAAKAFTWSVCRQTLQKSESFRPQVDAHSMKLAEAVYEQTQALGPTPLQGRLNYLHQLGKITLRDRSNSLVGLPQQREDAEFAVRSPIHPGYPPSVCMGQLWNGLTTPQEHSLQVCRYMKVNRISCPPQCIYSRIPPAPISHMLMYWYHHVLSRFVLWRVVYGFVKLTLRCSSFRFSLCAKPAMFCSSYIPWYCHVLWYPNDVMATWAGA